MEKMKDSEIGWIGEIPETWDITRVKYLAQDKESVFVDGDWIESDIIVESGIRYLTTGNVGAGYFKEQGAGYITEETFKKLNCLKVLPGDLMISRLNEPIGRACIIPSIEEKYVVAVDNVILRPDEGFDKKYLMYCMNTDGYANAGKEAARGATMQRVSKTLLGGFYVPVAPSREQKLIADFLDNKVGKINDILSDLNEQVAILQKYKRSLITKVVTKGLDSDVVMKNSGIDWIGDIPRNWIVSKLGYITEKIYDIDHYMPDDSEDIDKIPYVMIGDLEDAVSKIDYGACKFVSNKDYLKLSKKGQTSVGDVIFARYATIGTVCYVDIEKDFLVSYACLTIKPKRELEGKYMYYYFKSYTFLEEISQYINVNTQGNIGKESLINTKITLPTLDEQKMIVLYLDEKCSKIDELIKDKQTQIDKMESYKKSLIYEYVTGKKRVTKEK